MNREEEEIPKGSLKVAEERMVGVQGGKLTFLISSATAQRIFIHQFFSQLQMQLLKLKVVPAEVLDAPNGWYREDRNVFPYPLRNHACYSRLLTMSKRAVSVTSLVFVEVHIEASMWEVNI